MSIPTTETRGTSARTRESTWRTPSPFAGYDSQQKEIPLGGYAALMGLYAASVGGFFTVMETRLPTRISAADFALLAVATHKLTRIVALDWVTSPLRAPFTQYEGTAGSAELKEKARGKGLRRAIGELVTCPYCTGPWVAFGLVAGFVLKPRATRAIATIFAAVAASDWLHQGYAAAKKASG